MAQLTLLLQEFFTNIRVVDNSTEGLFRSFMHEKASRQMSYLCVAAAEKLWSAQHTQLAQGPQAAGVLPGLDLGPLQIRLALPGADSSS